MQIRLINIYEHFQPNTNEKFSAFHDINDHFDRKGKLGLINIVRTVYK